MDWESFVIVYAINCVPGRFEVEEIRLTRRCERSVRIGLDWAS